MLRILPHTLPATISQMYRLMQQHIPDVQKMRWRSVYDVYQAVQNLPYRSDATAPECGGAVECVKRPAYTLVLGGDCDDKAILAGAGLLSLGVPVRIVTASYRPDGEMQHTYLEVFFQGQWLPFDATYPTGQIFTEAPYTNKEVWA